jgi:hypothetical protein
LAKTFSVLIYFPVPWVLREPGLECHLLLGTHIASGTTHHPSCRLFDQTFFLNNFIHLSWFCSDYTPGKSGALNPVRE